ncbi:DUF6114 domain-containing protein [Streptacidiphilus jiangxiensis]|uniref:Uncharacterized protein n=1 Tax=Streptacidiphilus jiangxiensis TaxID=235985 RepID=A0A1H7UVE6_STRJI|nr:DUF6114 domain-containing protein [Streptacidiphilus jiangxiensis]SEM00943.1 hypothetical protein SAMN05414137_116197 [Streptacidiphilus jiangxiensis]
MADDDPAAPAVEPAAEHNPAPDPEAPPAPGSVRRARLAFRRWRRTRPFWGALWALWGGFVIMYFPLAPLGRILRVGIGGIYGMAAGALIMGLALLLLLMPNQRHVAGIVIVVAGTASFPLSNLGGFFVGMFCSILGGVMAFGWMPAKPPRTRRGLRRVRPEEPSLAEAAAEGGMA